MGLTGIQIFKLLPKTNCGECGVPTCLAFAMNLASGKAELASCPYVSEEAKAQLAEASAPPIRPLTIGSGDHKVKAGGETVLFRHEKTFYSPTGFAALVTTDMDEATVMAKLKKWDTYQYERVGLTLRPELVAIKDTTGDAGKFQALTKLVFEKSNFSLILMSEKEAVLKAGLAACPGANPLLYAATKDNAEALAALAKEAKCPLAVKGEGLEGTAALTEKLEKAGLKDLILDSGARSLKQLFEDLVSIRRLSLSGKEKRLGYPTICLPFEMTRDLEMETVMGALMVAKYGGVVVFSDFDGQTIFPLLLERLNIFTDPQRPMTVTQGIYEINGPDENSPVAVTSNFSLTYFIVSGEIEASRVPTWLCIMDTEGLSVMTAWAAGKFVGDAVGALIKKSGIADKVKHHSLIIPGYAASIVGDLEEELPGWAIKIGPREAAHIPKFLREMVKS
jgi:acetyl-CoA decarbonylase/synthase complex subunit gamma